MFLLSYFLMPHHHHHHHNNNNNNNIIVNFIVNNNNNNIIIITFLIMKIILLWTSCYKIIIIIVITMIKTEAFENGPNGFKSGALWTGSVFSVDRWKWRLLKTVKRKVSHNFVYISVSERIFSAGDTRKRVKNYTFSNKNEVVWTDEKKWRTLVWLKFSLLRFSRDEDWYFKKRISVVGASVKPQVQM